MLCKKKSIQFGDFICVFFSVFNTDKWESLHFVGYKNPMSNLTLQMLPEGYFSNLTFHCKNDQAFKFGSFSQNLANLFALKAAVS